VEKKILLVGWGFPPNIDGGLDIHVKHLFEELLEKDIDVTLVLPAEYAPERENIIGVETGHGGIVQRARKLSAGVAKIAEKYDIVHTHDWLGAESGFKARKYGDMKWISTMHSLSSNWSRDGSWEEVERMEKVAVEEPDELVSVSEKLAGDIEQEYGEKSQVVHNGFSTPESKDLKVKEKLEIEDEMIFFVGRHAEQKGIEYLLYGFKKFLEDSDADLVIGGDGYMRGSLEDFAEILEISEKVYFTGFIPSEILGDYYREADLFVSPSINEPFGLTITEALESGTPVVATENGVSELTDSIIDAEPESDSIAEAIQKGLEREEVRKDNRSWKEMTEELLEIYEEL
jgi:glycosyltransferase involved in cell wall biosynthesis